MIFDQLTYQIKQTHNVLQQSAGRAINQHLTIRNWLIGFYIMEFEQKGEDRAKYGEQLLQNVAKQLKEEGFSYSNLKMYRQLFLTYPQLSPEIRPFFEKNRIGQSLQIGQSPIVQFEINDTEYINSLCPVSTSSESTEILVPANKILEQLSYTHLVQLFPIKDHLKRAFYEIECMKGCWSVRELQRQIESLYFERCGLSKSPEKLSEIIQNKAITTDVKDIVKSPFTFEFLGLRAKEVVEESDLEQALIDHLEDFLLELGNGFCFEARQKRILIDNEYYFVDLVFYHRILKCHVLVELKTERFKHENISQLNSYVAYYRAEVMGKEDNPPVGILLCTDKSSKLVEYATAGMDTQLFVSKYMLELPSKEELTKFIQKEINAF